eukprot:316447_1
MADIDAQNKSNCSICKQSITNKDFKTLNYTIIDKEIEHKSCPKKLSFLWTNQFISTQSLHTDPSSISSAINAIEISLRLHLDQQLSVPLITNVWTLASSYHSPKSIEVSQILNNITRYNSMFTFLDSIQYNVDKINKSVTKLGVLSVNTAVSCIITSLNDPNMIVLLHKKYKSKQYILYQSQAQKDKGLNGAHILVFTG